MPSLSDYKSFKVVVNEVNSAPVLQAVANQTVVLGETMTLALVVADGDVPANALSYQVSGPPGMVVDAQTGVITWKPTAQQAGTNYVILARVTDNGVPSLSADQSFVVTVLAALSEVRLRVVARVNGQFAFRVEGNAGLSYTVQASSDLLQASSWRTLLTTNAAASTFIFVDTNAPAAQRFYRVTQP
jgi:hypothetical protein